jgi:hypothetical protein
MRRTTFAVAVVAVCGLAAGDDKPVAKPADNPNKPTVIKAEELARLGDYKGAFRTDAPEFAAFGKKYDGKLVKVTGRVATFATGLPTPGFDLQVTWKDPKKPKDPAYVVRIPVEVAKDGVQDRGLTAVKLSAATVRYGPPSGSATGKLVYDPDAKTVKVVEAIHALGWGR